MSKRKNMWKYVPAVKQWDDLLGMDKNGNYDKQYVIENVDATQILEALTLAVNACIMQFENNPSCPALDACLGLIYEGEGLGIDEINISSLKNKVNNEWQKFRLHN